MPGSLLALLLAGVAPAAAHPGVGVVIDSRGNVFYTDLRHVWRLAPNGELSIAVRDVHTHELYLDADDNLFGEHLWYEGEASDRWGHRVWRLSADGELSDVIPAREGFLDDYGYSFVRDGAGTMYWASSERTAVDKRVAGGEATHHASGFRDIRWMTSTSEGALFLIDDGALRRVSADGTVTTLAEDLRERSLLRLAVSDRHSLMGLWTDRQGNVYVAAYAGRVVKRVTPRGEVTVVARSPAPWAPTGGAVTADDDLVLLEYLATRARVRRVPLR